MLLEFLLLLNEGVLVGVGLLLSLARLLPLVGSDAELHLEVSLPRRFGRSGRSFARPVGWSGLLEELPELVHGLARPG